MRMSKRVPKLQRIANQIQAVIADIAEKDGVIITRVLTTSMIKSDGELIIDVNLSSIALKKKVSL